MYRIFLPAFLFAAQSAAQQDTICLPPLQAVEFQERTYKSAPAIDEFDPLVSEALVYRIFMPAGLAPGERRPLLLMLHGGGFIQGSYADFFAFCEGAAARGFVAASVQYRLCKRGDCLLAALSPTALLCNLNWHNSMLPSIYAATCDANDALRHMLAHAGDLHIDTSQIVVGGGSAGAFTALNMAFLDQDEAQSLCPGCGTWPDYLAEPLDPLPGIGGVIDLAGAVLDPRFMDADEMARTPVFALQGNHEETVPYASGPIYPCFCGGIFPAVFGADSIATRLSGQGASYFLYSGEGFGHDIGAEGFAEGALLQLIGFVQLSMLERRPMQRHIVVEANAPALCGNNPALAFPPVSALPRSLPIVVFEDDSLCLVASGEPKRAVGLRVFPNPAQAILHLELKAEPTDGPFAAEIFAPDGRLLRRLDLPGAGVFEWPLAGVLPGIYLLRLSGERGQLMAPICKVLIFKN